MGYNISQISQNGRNITVMGNILIVNGKEYELEGDSNNNQISSRFSGGKEILVINGNRVTFKGDKVFINGKLAKAKNDSEESFEPKEVENVNDANKPYEKPKTRKNVSEENNYMAEMSVEDAFNRMGKQPNSRQAEKIQQIIELHDPKVVEDVVERMMNNPTPAMRRLINLNVPVQSRNTLNIMKTRDIVSIIINTVLSALGIVGAATGEPGALGLGIIGVAGASFSISELFRHNAKIKNLDLKDEYVSDVIDELLQEVALDEEFNKGLER